MMECNEGTCLNIGFMDYQYELDYKLPLEL